MPFDSPESVMRHAIQLAQRGLGAVEPNPPVGAVIVDEHLNLISEGWHHRFGGPHAEVHALAASGELARGATLYCTLEPCSHQGKTPPCALAVIAAGIRRVIIGTSDPAPHVDGKGIALLRDAGIEVEVGVFEPEARRLIAPFRRLMLEGRPWVHAKWAMSLDGRIATRTGDSKWISNEQSRATAHELRGRCDAIVVGITTVLQDDPLLTARPPGPRVAVRVVLDSQARIPLTSQLVRTARDQPVLVATSPQAPTERVQALRAAGVETLALAGTPGDPHRPSLRCLLNELGRRRMTHVLLEGGAGVLGSAFDDRLVDECHVFVAPLIIGGQGALSPVGGVGPVRMNDLRTLTSVHVTALGNNVYLYGDWPTIEENRSPV
jgi:diaminohydroxyphosphoribosylaminopyrimidine deaminase / 5-amino-6-(5-phosphoribosylamino)uracil reductase